MKLVGNKDNQAVTTSLVVAKEFGKAHQHVMETIRKFTVENSTVKNMFAKATYLNSRNQKQPMYYMNRDGFSLLAMGFTGKRAMQFKLEFINQFNQMEKEIKSKVIELPKSPQEITKQLLSNLDANNEDIKSLKHDVGDLKDNMRITGSQEKALLDVHHDSAFKALGGPESNAYLDRKVRDKTFRAEWHEFKQMFHLPRYGELQQVRFEDGMKFLKMWQPNTELRFEIEKLNSQTSLDI